MVPPAILIAEDEADIQRLYYKALRNFGFRVTVVSTISEAQELLAREAFALFLCDIHLGHERAIPLLQQVTPQLHQAGAKIIVVSADASYHESCLEIGVDLYLEKPVSIPTLVTFCQRLTQQHD
ncbi:MAG TPA: response regulator [Thermoflexia bacterium]|nr:response regulator [Thermoflexia bacterium]